MEGPATPHNAGHWRAYPSCSKTWYVTSQGEKQLIRLWRVNTRGMAWICSRNYKGCTRIFVCSSAPSTNLDLFTLNDERAFLFPYKIIWFLKSETRSLSEEQIIPATLFLTSFPELYTGMAIIFYVCDEKKGESLVFHRACELGNHRLEGQETINFVLIC